MLGQVSLFLVPKGKADVHQTVSVRDSGNTIFTPSVGSTAGHVMREI